MQVILVRSMFKNCKQSIYVNFDQIITPEIFYEVISTLHDNSYKIVVFVSDSGGANIGLREKLNLSIESSSFKTNWQLANSGRFYSFRWFICKFNTVKRVIKNN